MAILDVSIIQPTNGKKTMKQLLILKETEEDKSFKNGSA